MPGQRSQQFSAVIRKVGLSPYVDVPTRVSVACAPFSKAGRVRVEGSLNGTPFQTSLVPIGSGRHRLFVNGGLRAAAGVRIGSRVAVRLVPTGPDRIRIPADVARGLRRIAGALEAFNRGAASHRRELLRSIDDARTPATRARRILMTAEHLLGRQKPSTVSPGDARTRLLWTCPRCGNQFVNRNQLHACGRYDLDDLFPGKPAGVRALFDRFRSMVEACGPVRMLVYRNMAGFMVRVRFAGATPKKDGLRIGFWLARRIDSPRLLQVETILPNVHVHRMHVTDPDQLDAQVAAWLREAYAVGCQQHLERR